MMDHETFVDKGLSGLANLGNTCYINTAVQCLSYCTVFLRYMLSKAPSSDADADADADPSKKGNIAHELTLLLHEMWMLNHSLIPKRFVQRLQMKMGKSMAILEQNDLQEFLMLFLNHICEDIGKPVPAKALAEAKARLKRIKTGTDQLIYAMENNWLASHAKFYSPLVDCLYGQHVMQVKCETCGYITHNHEAFFMLPISIPEKGTVHMNDAIAKHMDSELLDNIWTCDVCKKTRRAERSHKFWRLPDVLIVVAKRFTPTLSKIRTSIEVDAKLDLEAYCIYDTHCTYELKSIACHSGSIHRGHYYALCKHPNQKWYRIDDLTIGEVPDPTARPHAHTQPSDFYVFFYETKSAHARCRR